MKGLTFMFLCVACSALAVDTSCLGGFVRLDTRLGSLQWLGPPRGAPLQIPDASFALGADQLWCSESWGVVLYDSARGRLLRLRVLPGQLREVARSDDAPRSGILVEVCPGRPALIGSDSVRILLARDLSVADSDGGVRCDSP